MKGQAVTTTETLKVATDKKRRVGLLGGAFNPLHWGHLLLAEQVLDKLGLDEVAFMPTYQSPHSEAKPQLAAKHRLKMLELALADDDHFLLETLELERQGTSYTYETMDILTTLHPDTAYYFIIGGDMVNDLPHWYRIDDLMQLVQFVGAKRPGYQVQTPYPVMMVDTPQIEISSTAIRQQVQAGRSIRYQVPEAVRQYIKEEGLYLD